MKYFLSYTIVVYQKLFSPETGIITTNLFSQKHTCAFYPTCSEYTRLSIVKHGVIRGIYLGIKRIIKCTPFGVYKIDLVK